MAANGEQKRRAGPHAEDAGAVDARRGRRGRRENIRRDRSRRCGSPLTQRFGRKRFQISHPPSPRDQNQCRRRRRPLSATSDFTPVKSTAQCLAALDRRASRRCVHSTLPSPMHDEFHARAGLLVHFVIHAHAGGKLLRAAVQVDDQHAFGMGAEAACRISARRWSAGVLQPTGSYAGRPSPAWRRRDSSCPARRFRRKRFRRRTRVSEKTRARDKTGIHAVILPLEKPASSSPAGNFSLHSAHDDAAHRHAQPHKVGEIRAILGGSFQFLTLNDFPAAPKVVEDADTFAGNATKKAVELAVAGCRNPATPNSEFRILFWRTIPGWKWTP